MIVVIDNQEYMVHFTHVNEEAVTSRKLTNYGQELAPAKRHTECKILVPSEVEGEMPGFISIGYAKCHPKDNFNKEKGRQLSLSKALEDAEFDKETRTAFWNAYRNWLPPIVTSVIKDGEEIMVEQVRKRF